MSIHKFYPQHALVEAATLTDLTGASTSKENMLDYRRSHYAVITTVSAGSYWFKVDLGASNALAPTFIAFVDNNFYPLATGVDLILDSSPDAAAWTTIASDNHGANDTPIWVHTFAAPANARRYFRVRLGTSSANLIANIHRFGCMFIGTSYEPSIDPNYDQPIVDDSSGTTLNRASGGALFAVQRYADFAVHGIGYETLPTVDRTILENLKNYVGGSLKPFVSAIDVGDGTLGYIYARIVKDSYQAVQTQSGLWAVKFNLMEEVA